MLGRSLHFLVATALVTVVGCAGTSNDDDADNAGDALTGKATAGRTMQTMTDALRLRRTPSKVDTKNVIGLIPLGATVKIVDGTPQNGFYKIEVLDAKLRKELGQPVGWVYGDYLNGKAEEPAAEQPIALPPDQSATGTHAVPTEARVKVVISDCAGLTDDQGKPMAPTIDDVLTKGSAYAVLAIDTNTFSYGMKAKIKEVDAASSFNPGGVPVEFKIVKTAATAPAAGFTVTMCGLPASQMVLPTDADGLVSLSVFAQ